MVQGVQIAENKTIEDILALLPEPLEILVHVDALPMAKLNNKIPMLSPSSMKTKVANPSKKILKDIINLPYPRDVYFEEAFFAKGDGTPVNIKLTMDNIHIEFWDSKDAVYVAKLLENLGRFNDINVTVHKYQNT